MCLDVSSNGDMVPFYCWLITIDLFPVPIGHTSSSLTAYSPSHTETDSSGVPSICTYVRTWFLLNAVDLCLNFSCCVHKVTYGTLKGQQLAQECLAWPSSLYAHAKLMAMLWGKCDALPCLKDLHELRAIFMVDSYFVWIWRIAWLTWLADITGSLLMTY